ncbi:peptidase domain-containing ABC transporter [Methylomonas fluvii]|uniref:Peptidase domain-containing ABC transporter n=1 Tax=Methylomonas fluvii TaxID=1854564 RepID=A0ABR9DJZ5_9GAMM|nr:peptidase domain-containing ABC transporter [Methylomonas fluvii]MBD9363434.1 peptidase domain-containing ABC transporter [Methylomonas fluvii]
MKHLKHSHHSSYLQTTAAECGLACVGYVAACHGAAHSMSDLRAKYAVSLRGSTLMDLVGIGAALGFSCRPLRLELAELDQLSLPCILHWQMSHFVVLKKVARGRVLVHDPAKGEKELSIAEVNTLFTGVALELTPAPAFEHITPRSRIPLAKLVGKVDGLIRSLVQIAVLAVAMQLFALLTPIVAQWIVDGAIVSGDRDFLLVLALAYALIAVIKIVLEAVRSWLAIVLATQFNLQWAGRIIGHLLRLPVHWFELRHTGDIVSRFQSMQAIQQTLTGKLVEVVLDGGFGLIVLAVMLLYSPTLSAFAVAAVLAYLLIRVLPHGIYHRLTDEALAHEAKAQSHFLESIQAVHTTKLAGLEEQRRARWLNLFVAGVNKRIGAQKMSLGFSLGYSTVFAAEAIAVLAVGATMVMDNTLTVGMLMAFISYKDDFTSRMQRLIDNLMSMRMVSLHVERLSDIVLAEKEQTDGCAADKVINRKDFSPTIEFKNLGFRYGANMPWVFRNLHLAIQPGEHIAIVGASGCGKSTLVKLCLGLLEPTEGVIEIDGMPLSQFGLANWRRLVGAVLQEDQLFSGSLQENISGFDLQTNFELLKQSAQLAGIDNEIEALPMRYLSQVGDMGSSFSGGQKQRLIIARALYKVPSVLVLDEATSHLDVETERKVNLAINSLNITRLTIAHRPETIGMADRVVSLDASIYSESRMGSF